MSNDLKIRITSEKIRLNTGYQSAVVVVHINCQVPFTMAMTSRHLNGPISELTEIWNPYCWRLQHQSKVADRLPNTPNVVPLSQAELSQVRLQLYCPGETFASRTPVHQFWQLLLTHQVVTTTSTWTLNSPRQIRPYMHLHHAILTSINYIIYFVPQLLL